MALTALGDTSSDFIELARQVVKSSNRVWGVRALLHCGTPGRKVLADLALESDVTDWRIDHQIMVAPGVALTAKHTLDMFRAANGGNIDAGIHLFGAKSGMIVMWEVSKVVLNEPNDIAILIVHPLTELPPGNIVDVLALTTAQRSKGEPIEIFGYRAEQPAETQGQERIFHLGAYLAAGPITELYPERRDSSVCPFPCLEIMTATVGGMSGGPAFDPAGECCGLVSTSFDDDQGPTYVSMLWPVLTTPFQPIWPQGMYQAPVTLKNLGEAGIATVTEGFRCGTMRLHDWIDPQVQLGVDGQLKLHCG